MPAFVFDHCYLIYKEHKIFHLRDQGVPLACRTGSRVSLAGICLYHYLGVGVGGRNLGNVCALSGGQEHSGLTKNVAETSSHPLLSPHQVLSAHRHSDEPVPLRKFVAPLPQARGRLWGALLHGWSLFLPPAPSEAHLSTLNRELRKKNLQVMKFWTTLSVSQQYSVCLLKLYFGNQGCVSAGPVPRKHNILRGL